MFHRLVVPTYNGGLPAGYDLVNDPTHPSVAGAGVAAFADGKKSGGPNDGTYFTAFGEDATSHNANRGLLALAENTDFLDNLLRRDLAITARTSDVVAAVTTSTVVIAGDVFVGASGTPNTQDSRNRLISVLDANDNEILNGSSPVVAALIHDGSNNNVVGAAASGFYNGPTVTFTPAIPAGVTYRVYYGERTNLAELPPDAFTDIKIRGAQEVDADVQRLLRDLHAAGAAQAWDAPWDTTIRDLVGSTLGDRYNLATLGTGTLADHDTPGAGRLIPMAGAGIEYSVAERARGVASPDAYAGLKLLTTAGGVTTAFPGVTVGADVATAAGFTNFDFGEVQEVGLHATQSAAERVRPAKLGKQYIGLIPRHTTDGSPADITGDFLTHIDPAQTDCVLNPGGVAPSRARCSISGANYFRQSASPIVTAIRLGIDMLQIRRASGAVELYVIHAFVGATLNEVELRGLDGSTPVFLTNEAVALRLMQVAMYLGGADQADYSGPDVGDNQDLARPFFFGWMPSYTTLDTQETEMREGLFLSPKTEQGPGRRGRVFSTQAFGNDGELLRGATFYGVGGVDFFGGRQSLNFSGQRLTEVVDAGSGSLTYDWTLGRFGQVPGGLHYRFTAGGAPTTVVFNISADTAVLTAGFLDGDQLLLFLEREGTATDALTVDFSGDATVVFSGTDGVVPTTGTFLIKYTLTYLNGAFYAERTDY